MPVELRTLGRCIPEQVVPDVRPGAMFQQELYRFGVSPSSNPVQSGKSIFTLSVDVGTARDQRNHIVECITDGGNVNGSYLTNLVG